MFHPFLWGSWNARGIFIPPVVFHLRGCLDCTSVGGTAAIPKETTPHQSHALNSDSSGRNPRERHCFSTDMSTTSRVLALIYFGLSE